MKHLDLLSDLIKRTEKKIDELEWENHGDPRIESLVQQLNYYRNKEKQGEIYEPKF